MEEDGASNTDAQVHTGEDAAEDDDEQMDDEQGGAAAAPDVQPGERADTDTANPDSVNTEARESAAQQDQSTTTTGGAGQSAGKGADANNDEG